MPRRDSEALAEIGRRVRQARESRGWTQVELARAAGIAEPQTISNIERGRQAPEGVLGGLCEALGRSADWLLFGRDWLPPWGAQGAALRAAREVQGYSVSRLVAALGGGRDADDVERWEVGLESAPAEAITQIAAILGLDAEELLRATCLPHGEVLSVTNDDVRALLDSAGVTDPTRRFTFARLVATWNLDAEQARAALAALDVPAPGSRPARAAKR